MRTKLIAKIVLFLAIAVLVGVGLSMVVADSSVPDRLIRIDESSTERSWIFECGYSFTGPVYSYC